MVKYILDVPSVAAATEWLDAIQLEKKKLVKVHSRQLSTTEKLAIDCCKKLTEDEYELILKLLMQMAEEGKELRIGDDFSTKQARLVPLEKRYNISEYIQLKDSSIPNVRKAFIELKYNFNKTVLGKKYSTLSLVPKDQKPTPYNIVVVDMYANIPLKQTNLSKYLVKLDSKNIEEKTFIVNGVECKLCLTKFPPRWTIVGDYTSRTIDIEQFKNYLDFLSNNRDKITVPEPLLRLIEDMI